MSKKYRLVLCFFVIALPLLGQGGYTLKGTVTDVNKEPLAGATVRLAPTEKGAVADKDGFYRIDDLSVGVYQVEVSFLGYETLHQKLQINANRSFNIQLKDALMQLNDVVITGDYAERVKREMSLNVDVVNEGYLRKNLGGSLMNTLEKLPGVTTIDIGSGQSKPIIRGMSFNRVAVVENGIKHEAQQWGSDHGLEIDQYAVENVEVIKGPASLMYGSDAIGGVIDMKNKYIPEEGTFGGTVDLTAKSNNAFWGGSASLFFRKRSFFALFRATVLDYGDYKVPTDYVDIYSYRVPLFENHLRNTAGKEEDFHLNFGYIGERFTTRFFVSNVYSKSGFFANAHGLEPLNADAALHDYSSRDIQQPYQSVNHFKVTNESLYRLGNSIITLDLGFQRNFRQEKSQYVSHGYMPAVFPDTLDFASDLERVYDKRIYSANLKYGVFLNERCELKFGADAEFQQNKINGRGFIIPAYKQLRAGAFALWKQQLSQHASVQLGARYDYGHIHTESYNDWFPTTEVVDGVSTTSYLQRAGEIERNFSNFTWSAGYNFNVEHWSLKANVGKSFRMPIAKELGANGVNYHNYSYEVGDADLSPEESYQLDFGVEFKTTRFAIGVTPFVNYFPNYIYLNPTSEHDRLYGNGNQVFYYAQSRVFRWGGELHAHYEPLRNLRLGMVAEYLYSEQLSGDKEGFTLPFSPPASALFNVRYSWDKAAFMENIYLSADCRVVAKQTRIVPPEEPTDGYQTFGLGAGCDIYFAHQKLVLTMQVNNLFNTKYFNHTSFYRLINVPEAGRNFIVNLSFPFFCRFKRN